MCRDVRAVGCDPLARMPRSSVQRQQEEAGAPGQGSWFPQNSRSGRKEDPLVQNQLAP